MKFDNEEFRSNLLNKLMFGNDSSFTKLDDIVLLTSIMSFIDGKIPLKELQLMSSIKSLI